MSVRSGKENQKKELLGYVRSILKLKNVFSTKPSPLFLPIFIFF
jgi:hypothetical protein